MSRFNDKVALITGGGTGIGRATAEQFVAEGGRVVVVGRREEPLRSLSESHPDRVRHASVDIASVDGPKRALAFTVEQFGKIDVLINNAAVGIFQPLVEVEDKTIDLLFDVNIKGLIRLVRDAVPELEKTGGNVVNISSTASRSAWPTLSVYAGTKAAMERVTVILAVELGPLGIRVNAVAPGFTDTAMANDNSTEESRAAAIAQTPLGRIGQPADIARSVCFLASDEASWVTGQTLQSSGGFML